MIGGIINQHLDACTGDNGNSWHVTVVCKHELHERVSFDHFAGADKISPVLQPYEKATAYLRITNH